MRYAFTSKAQSILNRVHAAVMEVPLREYGSVHGPMIAMLWYEADRICDWSADSDVVLEMAEYKFLDEAYKLTIPFGIGSPSHGLAPEEKLAEDCYHQALEHVVEFENHIWLATILVNVGAALEGSAGNVFASDVMQGRINEEFKGDRHKLANEAREILAGNAVFDSLLHSVKS
jgi:hypothetical protein